MTIQGVICFYREIRTKDEQSQYNFSVDIILKLSITTRTVKMCITGLPTTDYIHLPSSQPITVDPGAGFLANSNFGIALFVQAFTVFTQIPTTFLQHVFTAQSCVGAQSLSTLHCGLAQEVLLGIQRPPLPLRETQRQPAPQRVGRPQTEPAHKGLEQRPLVQALEGQTLPQEPQLFGSVKRSGAVVATTVVVVVDVGV